MFEWVSLEIGLEEGKKTLLFEILEGNTNKPFLTDRKVIVVLHFQHFIHNKIQFFNKNNKIVCLCLSTI